MPIVKYQQRNTLTSLSVFPGCLSCLKPKFPVVVNSFYFVVDTFAGQGASGGVHSSLMVALEHSSGAVRAKAIEQLSRAMSASEAEDAAGESTAAAGEDVSPALLRRLQDEDPEVVLAITGSDYLVQQVLLRPATSGTSSEDDEVTDVSDFVLSIQRATLVTSASAAAAVPWLSALSEARPKHAVASSGRVLSGLLRLAAAAAACAAALSCRDVGEEGLALAKQARDSALSLCLECLPGPSAVARVKLAQQLASASVGVSGAGDAAAATATAAGKACKKAMRAVSRAAIEAVSGLSTGTGSVGVVDLFAGITAVLEQEVKGDNKASKSPSKNSKNKGKISKAVDDMEVERSGKSKGLKAMGEEVCGILATALVDASHEESKMEELQVTVVTCWYVASERIETDLTLREGIEILILPFSHGSKSALVQTLRAVSNEGGCRGI